MVANLIYEEFTQMNWDVSIFNIENINKEDDLPNIEEFDLIGIGSQVIGYTTPRRMNQFLKLLPVSQKGSKVFAFRTCGGVTETNYTASHYLIKLLKKKNYDVYYERLFSIGSNFVFKFDDAIMKQLYEATKRKVKIMCQEVVEGKTRKYKTSIWQQLGMKFITGPSGIMLSYMGKNMKVSDNCTKCGSCVRNCPSKNIEITKGKVSFETNCSACLRCVYNCPQKAISFRSFKFIPIKSGYDVQKSLSQDVDLEKETNGKEPAFFNRYINDDTM